MLDDMPDPPIRTGELWSGMACGIADRTYRVHTYPMTTTEIEIGSEIYAVEYSEGAAYIYITHADIAQHIAEAIEREANLSTDPAVGMLHPLHPLWTDTAKMRVAALAALDFGRDLNATVKRNGGGIWPTSIQVDGEAGVDALQSVFSNLGATVQSAIYGRA